MRKKYTRAGKEAHKEIVVLYLSGKRVVEIAQQYNIDPSHISKIIKKAGANKPKIERFQQIIYHPSEEEIRVVRELRESGMGATKISEHFGWSVCFTHRMMKESGVKNLSVSESKRKYATNEHWLDSIDTPEKAVFLGLFFADGCNNYSNNDCVISLNEIDEKYLESFRRMITERPLSNDSNKKKLIITSDHFSQKLCQYGAVPRKSLILEWVKAVPQEYIRYFMRGYFEGDGGFVISYGNKTPYYKIAMVGTKEFLRGASIFLESVGIACKIYKKTDKNTFSLNIHRKKDVVNFIKLIYSDEQNIAMERKIRVARQCLNDYGFDQI